MAAIATPDTFHDLSSRALHHAQRSKISTRRPILRRFEPRQYRTGNIEIDNDNTSIILPFLSL